MEQITNNQIPIIEPDKGGYWEVYPDRKIWHENPKMKFKSKEQMDKDRPQFSLLPHNDYELQVVDLNYEKRKKYQSNEEEDTVNFTFDIVGLRDGGPAIDVDGNEVKDRKAFLTGSKDNKTGEWRMGFMSDGTPSKLRQFVAYATGQDVEGELEIESWEELLGKTVYAEIVTYTNQKGQKSNKISRFLLPPKK